MNEIERLEEERLRAGRSLRKLAQAEHGLCMALRAVGELVEGADLYSKPDMSGTERALEEIVAQRQMAMEYLRELEADLRLVRSG